MPTRKPNTTWDGQLACAFGEPWMGAHFICQAWVEAITGKPARLADDTHLMPKQLTAGSQEGQTSLTWPQEGSSAQGRLF